MPLSQGNFPLSTTTPAKAVPCLSFETTLPTAQGWLTFSQSIDPANPYYADWTERFSCKEWITFPYSDAQIQADPNYKLTKIAE